MVFKSSRDYTKKARVTIEEKPPSGSIGELFQKKKTAKKLEGLAGGGVLRVSPPKNIPGPEQFHFRDQTLNDAMARQKYGYTKPGREDKMVRDPFPYEDDVYTRPNFGDVGMPDRYPSGEGVNLHGKERKVKR